MLEEMFEGEKEGFWKASILGSFGAEGEEITAARDVGSRRRLGVM